MSDPHSRVQGDAQHDVRGWPGKRGKRWYGNESKSSKERFCKVKLRMTNMFVFTERTYTSLADIFGLK